MRTIKGDGFQTAALLKNEYSCSGACMFTAWIPDSLEVLDKRKIIYEND